MSKNLTLFFLGSMFSITMFAAELNLADNGKTEYQIVIPDNTDATNIFAAKELKTFLKKISRTDFKILKLSEVCSPKRIYVGLIKDMRKLLPDVDFSQDHSSRIIIRTKGNNLFLTGTQSSGTLLAVYSFLEDCLGCRWWTAKASFIPSKTTLNVSVKDLDYTPQFRDVRLAYYRAVRENPIFATRLRNRTFSCYKKPEHKFLGGTMNYWPAYHSSFRLIPPQKYFSTHPEWFSFNRGKRTKNNQLCFSSDPDGLAQEIFNNSKSYLDKNLTGYLMVGQMDKGGYSRCQCEKCLQIEKEEGSPSGPIIRFMNKLSDLVGKNYPKAKVMTFAYWYSEKPPKLVKPNDNVVIFLCAYDYSQYKKLSTSLFGKSIKGWSKIAKNIIVWNYVAPYGHYLKVFPNLNIVADDIKFFAKYKVDGMFSQGDRDCSIGDFIDLRAYLISHLLWNPDLDTQAIIKEFLDNYYGGAGVYIKEYLDIVNNSNIAAGSAIIIPLDISIKCANLYKKALEKVAGNKTLTDRVIKARLSFVDNSIINALADSKYLETLKILGFKNIDEAINHLDKISKKYSATCYAENGPPFKVLIEKYRKANTGKTAEAPNIPNINLKDRVYFDMQELSPELHCSKPIKIIDDPEASNGSTMRMLGGARGWDIQVGLSKGILNRYKIKKVTMYASVKIIFTGKQVPANAHMFNLGAYNKRNKRNLARSIKYKDIKRKNSYNYYSLSFTIDDSDMIWVGAIGDQKYIKDVLFDRIVIVKK